MNSNFSFFFIVFFCFGNILSSSNFNFLNNSIDNKHNFGFEGNCKSLIFNDDIRDKLPETFKKVYDELKAKLGDKDLKGCVGDFNSSDFKTNQILIDSTCGSIPLKQDSFSVFALEANNVPCVGVNESVRLCLVFNKENYIVSTNDGLAKCIANEISSLTGITPVLLAAEKAVHFSQIGLGFSLNKELINKVPVLSFTENGVVQEDRTFLSNFFINTDISLIKDQVKVNNKDILNYVDIHADLSALVEVTTDISNDLSSKLDSSSSKEASSVINEILSVGSNIILSANGVVSVNIADLTDNIIPNISINALTDIIISINNKELDSGLYFSFNGNHSSTANTVLKSLFKIYLPILKALKLDTIPIPDFGIVFDLALNNKGIGYLFNFNSNSFGCEFVFQSKQLHCKVNGKMFVLIEQTTKYIAYEVKSFFGKFENELAKIFKKKLNDDVNSASFHMNNVARSSYAIENIN